MVTKATGARKKENFPTEDPDSKKSLTDLLTLPKSGGKQFNLRCLSITFRRHYIILHARIHSIQNQ